jgi:hypothetical protein
MANRSIANEDTYVIPSRSITTAMLAEQFMDHVVVVKKQEQLFQLVPNTIYLVDGIIDMGPHSINIPNGLVQIHGLSANISAIITNTPNSTLFVGGGDLFASDIKLIAGGNGTKMFDLVDPTGFSAIEFFSVNFEDTNELGVLKNFRQGFMFNCAIFGTKKVLFSQGLGWEASVFNRLS